MTEQERSARADIDSELADTAERPILVVEPPHVKGPYPVEGDPSSISYEVVARLALPAPDAEAVPSLQYCDSDEGVQCLDLQWVTDDPREPRGVWERSAVVTLPRQFGIAGYELTGEVPLLEREAGA
jgi:hypothetical protein